MKKRIIISIIGVLFVVIVWILKTVLLPSIFLGSNIKVVDANIATMKSVPFLDIKLRNIGKDVSVIKKVDIEIIEASVDYTPRIKGWRSIDNTSMKVNIRNSGWGPALNVTFKDLYNVPKLISILGINKDDLLWQGNIREGETIKIVYPFIRYMKTNFLGYHGSNDNLFFSDSVFGSISYDDVYKRHYSDSMIAKEKYWITKDTIYFNIFGGRPLPPSANYTITLDPEKEVPYKCSVDVSHELRPNTADRFKIKIDSTKSGSYLIKANIYYDENNNKETKIMRVKVEKVNSETKVTPITTK